eukprot:2207559-Amphidinium_carterae.1
MRCRRSSKYMIVTQLVEAQSRISMRNAKLKVDNLASQHHIYAFVPTVAVPVCNTQSGHDGCWPLAMVLTESSGNPCHRHTVACVRYLSRQQLSCEGKYFGPSILWVVEC